MGRSTTYVASPRSVAHLVKVYSPECVEGKFSKLRLHGVLGSTLGGGHCTLGWAAAPTARAAEGRLNTLQAIHAPLITSTTAPAGTVGGVLAGPIVCPYMRLRYMSTCAPPHSAPAHLGSVPERQTATPTRMLPTNSSKMTTKPVSPATVFAKMAGSACSKWRSFGRLSEEGAPPQGGGSAGMGRALGLGDPGSRESLRRLPRQRATRGGSGSRRAPKGPCPFAGATGKLVLRRLASLSQGDPACLPQTG